jgi:ATP-dependent RNA helicase SrmB
MEFNELELDDKLLRAIDDLEFKKPTIVQQEVIPVALNGQDVLADAPTGTGKTAAFLLPALQHLIDFPVKKLGLCRILVLTPTRELALQVAQMCESLAKYVPHIKTGVLIGGIEHQDQLDTISQKTDIVIATPGRLIEYLRKKMFDIKSVEMLVLDEADRMLDMGFIDDVTFIANKCSRREQTLLFSATLEGKLLNKFANEVLTDPVEVHVESPRSERKKIKQYKYYVDDYEHKVKLLKYLLKDESLDKVIVFIKTRERLMELTKELSSSGFEYVYLRGEMDQDKRIDAIKKFTNNQVKILLATDVAARGIDVVDTTHVINFDLPRYADVYVHRIGRTARAGRKGFAISLIEAHDVKQMERIERYTQESVDVRVVDELRPQHKIASFTKKKKKDKDDPKKEEKKVKVRKEKLKNKGKPDFLAKKIRKLEKEGLSKEEIAKILDNEMNKPKIKNSSIDKVISTEKTKGLKRVNNSCIKSINCL